MKFTRELLEIENLEIKEADLNKELASKVQDLKNSEDVKSTMDNQQVFSDKWSKLVEQKNTLYSKIEEFKD